MSDLNVCTCSHKRNNHEGYRSLHNRNVYECKEDKCSCTNYSQKSMKYTPVQHKYMTYFMGLIIAGIIGAVLIGGFTLFVDANYTSFSYAGIGELRELTFSGNMTEQGFDDFVDEHEMGAHTQISYFVLFISVAVAFVFLTDKFEAERRQELLE